jgi:hypothetical protein
LDSYYGAPERERKRKINFRPGFLRVAEQNNLPLNPAWARYTPRQSAGETIQSSSVVERSAVNSESGFCHNFAHIFSEVSNCAQMRPFSFGSIRLHAGRPPGTL